MLRHPLRVVVILVFLFLNNFLFCQSSSDSLNSKSFEYLFERFESSDVFEIQDIYASAIITKAKKENDTIPLVAGYSFKSQINSDWLHLAYLDSIIDIYSLKNTKYQPAIAFLNKGLYYYNKGDFKTALENVIEARRYAKLGFNKELELECNQYIATFKTRLGDSYEALEIFRENLEYYQEVELSSDRIEVLRLSSLYSIAVTYNDLGQFDSTSYYNKWGFEKALESNNVEYQNYFRFNQGVNLLKNNKHDEALDSLIMSMPVLEKINDRANLAIANFYVGKI